MCSLYCAIFKVLSLLCYFWRALFFVSFFMCSVFCPIFCVLSLVFFLSALFSMILTRAFSAPFEVALLQNDGGSGKA